MNNSSKAIHAVNIQKYYGEAEGRISVLQELSLDLDLAERVAIVGRSGSGKSTLLHVLAGLDTANAGSVTICGEDMLGADANGRAALRGAYMGFVYQNHHLLPEFSALENVAMPMRIAGLARRPAESNASDLLAAVGLSPRRSHLPSELSGGERQRVAVARALAGNPSVVLADEPTGNLDRDNAADVMALVEDLSEELGIAFLVVTHDISMLDKFDRVLSLVDGRLSEYSNA